MLKKPIGREILRRLRSCALKKAGASYVKKPWALLYCVVQSSEKEELDEIGN